MYVLFVLFFIQTGVDRKELNLEFSVPVGRREHKVIVILGTIVSAMAGALCILWPIP